MSVQLMSSVWTLDLSHAQQSVALAMADHGNDDGSAVFPSLAFVGWKTGYSERQVRRIVRELVELGLLVKVADERGHRAVEYRMDVGAVSAKPAFERKRRADKLSGGRSDRADIDDHLGRTSETPRADIQVSAEPSLEPSPEPSSSQLATHRFPIITNGGRTFDACMHELDGANGDVAEPASPSVRSVVGTADVEGDSVKDVVVDDDEDEHDEYNDGWLAAQALIDASPYRSKP